MTSDHDRRHAHPELDELDSSQIRARIARTRAAMDDTVDELAHRLKPRTLFEELGVIADFDSDTGARLRSRIGDVGRRFVQQVEQQPLPAALVGVGIAWLALGGRGGSDQDASGDREHGRLREKAHAAADQASATWHKTKDLGTSIAHGVKDAASSTRRRAERVGETLQHGYRRTRDGVERTLESAPLALGAGAMALGLWSGLMLPRTRAEDRALGEASDELSERGRRKVSAALDRAEDAATAAVTSAADAALRRDR